MASSSLWATSIFDKIDIHDRRHILALLAIPTIAIFAGRIIRGFARQASLREPVIFKSPPKTLEEAERTGSDISAYPPDVLQGARDVDTPYGSIRVYEWGPLDGRKVLFVHGISTPCIANAEMATQLVEEAGCRVILFDLFGRGYSDTPDSAEYKQDIRLFTSQILLVLSSSPLPWTGKGNAFTLVGYSLGGGISASFTSWFPQLVDSLVLIAPAGLMRANRFHWSSKLIYGGILPDLYRNFLVTRRLVGSESPKKPVQQSIHNNDNNNNDSNNEDNRKRRGLPTSENAPSSTAALIPHTTGSAADTVAWQVRAHTGFLAAFISSIRYGPITNQHERWRLIGSRLTAQKSPGASKTVRDQGLREGKVLIIVGKDDSVVVPEETAQDAIETFGEDNVVVELLNGGHDVPYTNTRSCVDAIRSHWEGE